MVEHWYSVVYIADHRCTTIIQIHHLSVKFPNVSHYIRNFKEQFSTGSEKILLPVRSFRSDLSTGFRKALIYLQKKHSNWHLSRKISFQMVADEKSIFRSTSRKIVPRLHRIFKITSRQLVGYKKVDFRPSWSEVQNPTSAQLGQMRKKFICTVKEHPVPYSNRMLFRYMLSFKFGTMVQKEDTYHQVP